MKKPIRTTRKQLWILLKAGELERVAKRYLNSVSLPKITIETFNSQKGKYEKLGHAFPGSLVYLNGNLVGVIAGSTNQYSTISIIK